MINNILEDNWTPSKGDHGEIIYYIAVYVLRVVHGKGNDNVFDLLFAKFYSRKLLPSRLGTISYSSGSCFIAECTRERAHHKVS